MELKCIKRYVDKYTHEMIESGTILKDVQKTRADELLEAGVVEKISRKKNTEE